MASPSPSPSHHLPLKGKTAIVTGSSRGIGAGIALELGKRGVVIIHSSSSSAPLAEAVSKSITSLPHAPLALTVSGNLSDPSTPEEIVGKVKSWLESEGRELKIDILVNNAGVEVVKALGEITTADFAKAVLPYPTANGRITNISSVGSRAGFKNLGLYCSSKAALEGSTRCWATELGKNGTTVNALNPGPVESEMLDNVPKDIVRRQKEATPVENRVGTVEEVADVVGWWAGGESRWVTGQCLSVRWGWSMY